MRNKGGKWTRTHKDNIFHRFCSSSSVVGFVFTKSSTASLHTFLQGLSPACTKERYSPTNKSKLRELSQAVSQTTKRSVAPGDDIGTPKANAIPKPITVISTVTRKKKDTDKEEMHLAVPNKEKQNSISLMSSKAE